MRGTKKIQISVSVELIEKIEEFGRVRGLSKSAAFSLAASELIRQASREGPERLAL
jgi:hypothetical protein